MKPSRSDNVLNLLLTHVEIKPIVFSEIINGWAANQDIASDPVGPGRITRGFIFAKTVTPKRKENKGH